MVSVLKGYAHSNKTTDSKATSNLNRSLQPSQVIEFKKKAHTAIPSSMVNNS